MYDTLHINMPYNASGEAVAAELLCDLVLLLPDEALLGLRVQKKEHGTLKWISDPSPQRYLYIYIYIIMCLCTHTM